MIADPDTRRALIDCLAWQVELGASEAIAEAPQDRFAESRPKPGDAAADAPPTAPRGPDLAAGAAPDARPGREAPAEGETARALAAGAQTLEELAEALSRWDGSPLRHGARNCVFADGNPAARVMVIGEAPGAEEDRIGKPFVGRAGQLLDRMLAAIGLSRTAPAPEDAAYITNILPWRPPGNRTPSAAEAALFLPFVERHIELVGPEIILSLGNTPTKALLATTSGIKRMRGSWRRHEASGVALMSSFHPAYLLRDPAEKRLAWRDLLAVRAMLDGAAPKIGEEIGA